MKTAGYWTLWILSRLLIVYGILLALSALSGCTETAGPGSQTPEVDHVTASPAIAGPDTLYPSPSGHCWTVGLAGERCSHGHAVKVALGDQVLGEFVEPPFTLCLPFVIQNSLFFGAVCSEGVASPIDTLYLEEVTP
jgi:hypothetical protein